MVVSVIKHTHSKIEVLNVMSSLMAHIESLVKGFMRRIQSIVCTNMFLPSHCIP